MDDVSARTQIQVQEAQIDSLLLKVFYMILLAGRPLPKLITPQQFQRHYVQPFTSRAAWRISAYVEAENKRIEEKKKL